MSATQRNARSREDDDKYGVYKKLDHISGLLQMLKRLVRPPQGIVISIS